MHISKLLIWQPFLKLKLQNQSTHTYGTNRVHSALHPQKRDGLLGTGTGSGREWKSQGSTMDTAQKRPERLWTTTRTLEVLRRCPLAIAQRLVHCAIAVSTAVLGRVTKTMPIALLLRNNSQQKKSNFRSPAPPPCSWSLVGYLEGPAPPPSSWSFHLAWNPDIKQNIHTY